MSCANPERRIDQAEKMEGTDIVVDLTGDGGTDSGGGFRELKS